LSYKREFLLIKNIEVKDQKNNQITHEEQSENEVIRTRDV